MRLARPALDVGLLSLLGLLALVVALAPRPARGPAERARRAVEARPALAAPTPEPRGAPAGRQPVLPSGTDVAGDRGEGGAERGERADAEQETVRVHGRVQREGAPVAGLGLSFVVLDAEDEEDWDLTGADGDFEVRLPPGSYAVLEEDGGTWASSVHVPPGSAPVRLDVHLSR